MASIHQPGSEFNKESTLEGVFDNADSGKWKDDGVFTDQDKCYPIELFIHLLEGESAKSEISDNAKLLLDIPALPKLEESAAGWGPECSWEQMKIDLVTIFGRQTPYTTIDSAAFIRSLRKGQNENLARFLLRVQWVLNSHLSADDQDSLVKLLFLAGLSPFEVEQACKDMEGKSIADSLEHFKHSHVTIKADPSSLSFSDQEESEDFYTLIHQEENNEDGSEGSSDPDDFYEDPSFVPPNNDDCDDMLEIKDEFSEGDKSEQGQEKSLQEQSVRTRSAFKGKKKLKATDDKNKNKKLKLIACEDCPETFRLKKHLKEHMLEEHKLKDQKAQDKKLITCEDCPETFRLKKHLKEHRLKEHNLNGQEAMTKKGRYCGICDESFQNVRDWDNHEEKHHLGKCLICGLEINDLEVMVRHHRKDHRAQAICPECSCKIRYSQYGRHNCTVNRGLWDSEMKKKLLANRAFRSKFRVHALKEGEKIDTDKTMTFQFTGLVDGVVKWFCGHCKQEFQLKTALRTHIKASHKDQVFKCDICHVFTTKDFENIINHKVNRHEAVTESAEMFRCPVVTCGFKFARSKPLELHIKESHSESTKADRTCKVCGKEMSSPYSLKHHVEGVHMKLYKVMKKYKCDHCDKTFGWKEAMLTHMKRRHSINPDVPVTCTICGRQQQNQQNHDVHMRQSHNSSPMECEHCGKVYKNKAILRKHIKALHTERKKHQCSQCDVKYADKYKLFLHVKRVHEGGLQPWSCKLCNKGFGMRKDAAIHIASNHEKWSFADAKKHFRKIIESQHPALIRNKLSAKSNSSDEEG